MSRQHGGAPFPRRHGKKTGMGAPTPLVFLCECNSCCTLHIRHQKNRFQRPWRAASRKNRLLATAGPTSASGTLGGQCRATMVHCNYCACEVDVEVDDANGFS